MNASTQSVRAADPCAGAGLLTVDEALIRIMADVQPVRETERLPLSAAFGRVLAADHHAVIDVPGFDNSAMDGYAVRSCDTRDERLLSVSQRIPAGQIGLALAPGTAARVFTGAPLPPGADSVVRQEECRVDAAAIHVSRRVEPGENVRPRGHDVGAGNKILARGEVLTPQAAGLAASVGLATVSVYRRPRVAVFFTGDELADWGADLLPGQIYNSNRAVLLGLVRALGLDAVDLGTVDDCLEATGAALKAAAAGADVILTTGGVSVGEEDHVRSAVLSAGTLDLWRVAIKPGKPLAFGAVGGVPFFGLPGNPVSALVTFLMFSRPYLLRLAGRAAWEARWWPVSAGFTRQHPQQRCEFLRARLRHQGDTLYADPCAGQSSDALTGVVRTVGLVEIPARRQVAHGDMLRFFSYADLLG
ncbi:MAG: molybdopterin molybdotransferase MoeA [Gammaproteobacteria bacterium]